MSRQQNDLLGKSLSLRYLSGWSSITTSLCSVACDHESSAEVSNDNLYVTCLLLFFSWISVTVAVTVLLVCAGCYYKQCQQSQLSGGSTLTSARRQPRQNQTVDPRARCHWYRKLLSFIIHCHSCNWCCDAVATCLLMCTRELFWQLIQCHKIEVLEDIFEFSCLSKKLISKHVH